MIRAHPRHPRSIDALIDANANCCPAYAIENRYSFFNTNGQGVTGPKGFTPLASFDPLTLCVEIPMRFVTHFALLAPRFAGLATNHFPQPIADA